MWVIFESCCYLCECLPLAWGPTHRLFIIFSAHRIPGLEGAEDKEAGAIQNGTAVAAAA